MQDQEKMNGKLKMENRELLFCHFGYRITVFFQQGLV